MREPLRVFLVEDEVLLLMQLEAFLGQQGHVIVGSAVSSCEAVDAVVGVAADLALVDIHLADGPTGIQVGRFIAEHTGMTVAFMTANPKRLPEDLSGAIGVIAKPYTQQGLRSALDYIEAAIREPPPRATLPRSLSLAPCYRRRWCAAEAPP